MCFAVWRPSTQLHSGEGTDGTRACYKRALKPFFSVFSCTAKAVSGYRRSWCTARTSVLGGASMDEQGFSLRLATCCARIVGLFALLTFVGLTDGRDRHLETTEGPR